MMATFGLSFAYAFYRRGTRDKALVQTELPAAGDLLPGRLRNVAALRGAVSACRRHAQSFSPRQWPEFPRNHHLVSESTGLPGNSHAEFLRLRSGRPLRLALADIGSKTTPIIFRISWGSCRSSLPWRAGRWAPTAAAILSRAAAGILLLLSLGHFTPVFALARLLLPPLAVVRFPIKLLVHVMFLVAILAGWGFDALRGAAPPWKAPRKRLALPLQIFLGCTVLALGIAWLAPGLIKSPAQLGCSTASEELPLTSTRFRIIWLPCSACSFPAWPDSAWAGSC